MTTPLLSAEEYQILVEQAPILIWRAGPDTRCNYFNERWLSFTGRTLEQEQGNGWAEGVHPEDMSRCLEIYLSAFGRRDIFEMEYRLRRADGFYRWLFDRGVPFFSSDGTFAGYIGSCTDVTDRVEAQEELKRGKEAEIQALRGLLPICMYCKKIRDNAGSWQDVAVYISERSKADFTHGICPACLVHHYPEDE
ncbi:MAG: PAS domain-containing protein [Thermodesulfobacteriota bacterium]